MLVCDDCFHFLDIDRCWRVVAPKQRGKCEGCNNDKDCYYLSHKAGWKASSKKSVL